jgi:hypothetical protein
LTKVVNELSDPEGYVGLAAIYRKQNRAEELLDVLAKAFKGKKGLERLDDEIETIGKDEKLVDAMIEAGKKLSTGDAPKLNFFGSYILAKLAARNRKTDSVVEFYRFAAQGTPQPGRA